MDISIFAFKLIVLLLPGIICSIIVKRLTIKSKWESTDYVLNSLLYGGLSYIMLQLISSLLGYFRNILFNTNQEFYLKIWTSFMDDKSQIPFDEILKGCLTGFILGFFISKAIEENYLNKIAQKLGFTSKYGDENLFYQFLGESDVHDIYLRNRADNIVYHGYVDYLSEDEDIREISLSEVDVYRDSDSKFLYSMRKVYICFPKDKEFIVELSKPVKDEKETRSKKSISLSGKTTS